MHETLIQEKPPQYLAAKPKEEDMKAWAVRFDFMLAGKNRQLFLFQRFSPSRMMKRKGFIVIVKGGRYELVKEDYLSFKEEIDVVVFDGQFLVLDRKAFESIFGFQQVYEQKARRILDMLDKGRLNKEVAIVNAAILRQEFLQNKRSVRKLFRIDHSSYFKKIKIAELKKLNKKYKLQLKFSGNKWIITEQTSPEVVLNILNDDYNRSLITDIEYRSEGKQVL